MLSYPAPYGKTFWTDGILAADATVLKHRVISWRQIRDVCGLFMNGLPETGHRFPRIPCSGSPPTVIQLYGEIKEQQRIGYQGQMSVTTLTVRNQTVSSMSCNRLYWMSVYFMLHRDCFLQLCMYTWIKSNLKVNLQTSQ